MLLHWCTLEPAGVSHLAAIRFSSPTRVKSIRIFPAGVKPFASNPDIVARTAPEAFFLELFFNAQSIHAAIQVDVKQKSKPANALVLTSIAYAGGVVDFIVDMGTEHATRLMIVKGNFESISLAIYGDIVSDGVTSSNTYEPRSFRPVKNEPLSHPLDPANSSDPTSLPIQLLPLITDAPPLPFVIRLVFCLKPANSDWDHPDFPYLYPDLDEDLDEFALETVYQYLSRPVPDDIDIGILRRFSSRVAALMQSKDQNQTFLVAGILSQAASQHPALAQNLIQELDLEEIFIASHVDELTALRLLNAVTNADIARHLNNVWFTDFMKNIVTASTVDQETKVVAQKVLDRMRGWQAFEDALSNTQGDFRLSAEFLKDIGMDEQCFGIWLESVITHEDVVMKLRENAVLPTASMHPPNLFANHAGQNVGHDEFISFVRAFIGVAGVLAVYAWADSLPHDRCRERALGILRLWQGIDGYREIVNHLLLLPQMSFRLECMISENDPPRHSGLHAEYIVTNLANEPLSFMRRGFVECVLALKQPLSYITEDERLSMRFAALVADDGLRGSVDELLAGYHSPLSLSQLRAFRVSLALIERELDFDSRSEWRVLQTLWDLDAHGFVLHLLDVFLEVVHDLQGYFSLTPPTSKSNRFVDQLFRTSDEALRIMIRLIPVYMPSNRSVHALSVAVANVFVCTDAADVLFAQTSCVVISAQMVRQTCIDMARALCDCPAPPLPIRPISEVVLRSLLQYGIAGNSRDPAYHVQQVFVLIDCLLPVSLVDDIHAQETLWVASDIPNLLPEVESFFRALDVESKLHFFRRLLAVDQGNIGFGEWMLLQELKYLSRISQSIKYPSSNDDHSIIVLYDVHLSLRFIDEVLKSSNTSSICMTFIGQDLEAAHALTTCVLVLLDGNFVSPSLTHTAGVLLADSSVLNLELKFVLMLVVLRGVHSDETSDLSVGEIFKRVSQTLKAVSSELPDLDRLCRETAEALSRYSQTEALETCDEELAGDICSTLEWLVQHMDSDAAVLKGISGNSYGILMERLRQLMWEEPERIEVLAKVQMEPQGVADVVYRTVPDKLQLPLSTIQSLLQPDAPLPSTPPQRPISDREDIFGLVTVSPPIAVLRSPLVTGLTKTYLNNDFRQLRQAPQNTSRLPSVHVDEFQLSESPPSSFTPHGHETFPAPSPPFHVSQ